MPIDPLGIEATTDDPLGIDTPREQPRFLQDFPRQTFSDDPLETIQIGQQLERESPFGAAPFRAQADWQSLTQKTPAEDLSDFPVSVQESTYRTQQGAKETASLSPEGRTKLIDDINLRYGAYISQASRSGRNDVANSLEDQRRKALEDVGVGTIEMFPEPNLAKLSPKEQEDLFGKGRLANIIGAGQRAIASTAEGFATPEGLAMAVPGAGSAIGKAFLAQMIAHAPQEVASAAGAYSGGDTKAGDEHLINAGATLALLGAPLLASKLGESPTRDAIRELVKQLDEGQIKKANVDLLAQLRNQLPPRAKPEGFPEAERTAQLMDEALKEATQKIIEPGKIPAMDLLKAQDAQILEQEPTRAISAEGGGEAIGGKVSFMRPAEAPLADRTQRINDVEREQLQKLVDEESSQGATFDQKGLPEGVSYRRSKEAPSQEEYLRNRRKEDLESGLAMESGYYLDEPTGQSLPEPPPVAERIRGGGTVVDIGAGRAIEKPIPLSKLQRGRLINALRRGASEQTIINILRLQEKPKESPPPEAGPTNLPLVGEQSAPVEAASLTSKLESLKTNASNPEGKTFSLPHPDAFKQIGKQVWNDAIDLAIAGVKGGKKSAEAMDEAISFVKKSAKGFDEAKLRQNLDYILKNEFPIAPTNQEKPTPSVNNPISIPTLEDVYKRFEPPKEKATSLKQKGSQVIESLRTGISSKFRPLNKLAEDIAKAYGRNNPKDIAGIFEQLKGSQGKGEAEVYRFDRDVSRLVKGSEKDFNAYLFLKRSIDRLQSDQRDIETAQAGGEIKTLNRKKVSNYTLNELNPKLELLKQKLGPEKVTTFDKAFDRYQEYMDQTLRLQVESGRMSEKVYQAIKQGNPVYAPFKVMKWIEETTKPSGTSRQIDTLAQFTKAIEGIEDRDFHLGDMLSAARQNILLSRILADKNTAMRNIADLAPFDVEKKFIQKLPTESDVPFGMEAVNVMENGKNQRYAVNKDVAEAVKNFDASGRNIITRFLGRAALPFRIGATTFNLPFQVSNLLADVPRQALVSKYGVKGVQDLVRYPLDFVHSLYSSIAGDVFGKDNKLFLDFLDSGVAGTTVQEYLTPKSLQFQPTTALGKIYQGAKNTLNLVPEFAKAIEQTSKVLGVKRAMRFEGVSSGQELAKQIPEAITELRRFSGSPDFGRQGKAVEAMQLNLLYMFLNARIQGAVADIGRLTGRDGAKTAAATWAKVGAAIGVPTAYLYYVNHSAQYKQDYEKRSAQERQNYWMIPKDSFITTPDGEKIRDFWRIPKREIGKWMANLTESALDFVDKKDPHTALAFGNQMLQELAPVNIQGDTLPEKLESVASGLNPLLKAPAQLATGRDFYRHKNLIPDTMKEASPEEQYTERTPEVFKQIAKAMPGISPEALRSPIMLENLTRDLTAGMFTQFLPRKPVEGRTPLENTPLLQRFQAIPYEDGSEFKQQMEALKRESADDYLKRNREAQKILEANKGKNVQEIIGKIPHEKLTEENMKLYRQVVDLWMAKENGATSQDQQLISLPPKQRAEYIAAKLQNTPEDQRGRLFWELAKKRVLTADTFAQLPEVFKPLAEKK